MQLKKYKELVSIHVVTNLPSYGLLILLVIMTCHYFNAVEDMKLVCEDRPEIEVVAFYPKTLKEKADSICEDYTAEYDLPDN